MSEKYENPNVTPEHIYYYKDKPYFIVTESKMKIEGVWYPCIIYQCLYENPDGMIWVRKTEDFFELFKKK